MNFKKLFLNANKKTYHYLTPLKILCISDTHGTLNNEEIEKINNIDYDVCFLLGDIFFNDLNLLKDILIKEKTYGILGNHDDLNVLEKFGFQNFHKKLIEINGVKFIGIEGSQRYKMGDYPMYTEEEMENICQELEKADILVTHASFYDKTNIKDKAHSGFKAFNKYLLKNKVSLHIHGHLHTLKKYCLKKTKCICVYKCCLIEISTCKIVSIF